MPPAGGRLTLAEIDELRRLAGIGHVRGLSDRLAELSRTTGDPALPRLRDHATGIRLQELAGLLDELQGCARAGNTQAGADQLGPA